MTDSPVNEAVGFERFVADKGRGLLRAAWLLTGDHHHAEDLVQTALAKTWGRYAIMANDHKFEAYVRTTIYRTYVSWWRRTSWRSERPHDNVTEREVADGVDCSRSERSDTRENVAVSAAHICPEISSGEQGSVTLYPLCSGQRE